MTTQIKAGVIAANAVNSSELASGALSGQNFTGDVTFDTTTLFVDSTNNRVGIKTTSPSNTLDVVGGFNLSGNLFVDTNVLATDVANNRVGIGTTSPTADLSVGSTSTSSGDVHLRTTKTAFSITPSNTDAGGILFDLGWVNGGQGPMKFGINASEKMRIASDGNVGIGDTSPIAKLTVKAASDTIRAESLATDAKNITMSYEDSNDFGAIRCGQDGVADKNLLLRGANLLFQRNGGTEAMRIDSSGNVQIADGSKLVTKTTSGEVIRFERASDSNRFSSITHNSTDAGNAFISFKVHDGSTATSQADVLHLLGSGNVGIGTTSPSEMLHMNNTTGTACFIRFQNTGGSGVYIGGRSEAMEMYTNGSEKMRITSSGTLLVSTTTTSGLSNGTTNYGHSFGGGQQVNATNDDTNLILNMSNGSSNPHVQFRSDGSNTGNISTNGSAVAYNTGSDYRLKENVLPLKDGLDRLNKLNPVQFDWKKSQETDEGFIAHEVQEIVPYVVKGEKDGEKIQTMDYGKLTPLLVKAIQEQQTIIDDLKSRLDEAGL